MHAMHASTSEMNPMVPAAWLAQRKLEDPELYQREFEAQWIDGASSYLSAADLQACVRTTGVLSPRPDRYYRAACDVAFAHDRTALTIAHREPESQMVVVDGCWTWHRAGFERTLEEVSDVARAYRVFELIVDQFAEAAVREGLQRRGLDAIYKPWTVESKANAFGRLKVAVNTRAVELPDDSALMSELVGLEARPLPSGLTRIAAAGSGYDDRATATAAVVAELTGIGAQSQAEMDAGFGLWRCRHGNATEWKPGKALQHGCGCRCPADDPFQAILGSAPAPQSPTESSRADPIAPEPSLPPEGNNGGWSLSTPYQEKKPTPAPPSSPGAFIDVGYIGDSLHGHRVDEPVDPISGRWRCRSCGREWSSSTSRCDDCLTGVAS
jgi:hypothetical protein